MVETKAISQGKKLVGNVAKALCHSESTAEQHYLMAHAEMVVHRHATITRVNDTVVVDEYIRQK